MSEAIPGAPESASAPEPQSPPIPYTREFVVDDGYATRATRAVVTDFLIRRPTLYIGLAAILLGVALLTARGTEFTWAFFLLFGLLVVLVFPVVAFFATRRAFRKQVPVGSRLRSGFGVDRFVVDTPTATTSVAYTLYRGARRKGEFVYLRQRSTKRWLAFPGALFGDDDLARFPQQ